MIDSRKSILKPNIEFGDVLVDTRSHTIFKVTRVKINRHWSRHYVDMVAPLTGEKRGEWMFSLVGQHSRYHKL